MGTIQFTQTMPVSHRKNVTAADVLAAPTLGSPSAINGGGLTAGAYKIAAVGVNTYGRTVRSSLANQTTATTNLTVEIPITQLVGATAYDIYCSTDADPKWVCRITEAQRAAGIIITGVGTTGGVSAGGAGTVDITAIGTGQAALTTAAVNTAYVIPSQQTDVVVAAQQYEYVDFEITMSLTGDAVSAALTVIPFVWNGRTNTFAMVDTGAIVLTFGGTTGNVQPLIQRVRVRVRADSAAWLLVSSIAGSGASVNIDATLN